MSNETVETIRVACNNEQGFYLINKSDFNKEVHTLFEAPKAPAKPPKATGAKKGTDKGGKEQQEPEVPEVPTAEQMREYLLAAEIAFSPDASDDELKSLFDAAKAAEQPQ